MTTAGEPVINVERPRLRSTVHIGEVMFDGPNPKVFVTDTATGLYLRVGPREAFLFRMLDGTRNRQDVSMLHERRYGQALDEPTWGALLATLAGRCLLESAAPALIEQTAAATARLRQSTGATLLHRRFPLPGATRTIPAVTRAMGWLFHPAVVAVGTVVAASVVVWAVLHLEALLDIAREAEPRASFVAVVLLVTVASVALHEYGHGVACWRFGGMPQEMGILWRFPILTAYCKVDHVMVLPRRQRVMVSFAGVYLNLLLLVPYAALWRLAPEGSFAGAVGAGLLLFGLPTAAVNLVPIFFLDGYRMVEHWTGSYNLAAASMQAVGHVLGRRWDVLARYPRQALHACLAYAVIWFVCVVVPGVLLVRVWWVTLASFLGPVGSTAFLVAEALVVVLLIVLYRRNRARRAATDG